MSRKWLLRIIFLAGFLLLLYPLISNMVHQRQQSDAVASYDSAVSNRSEEEIQEILNQATEYNNMLFQSNGAIVDNMDTSILSDESYNSLLNQANGIMGSIEIPKIDVDLPVYHGTEEDILSVGVGHIQGTSLPVGGENTHCVLSGHRGLPGSSLFTRLDEIKEGDLFFLSVMGETLAYKVYDIQVVDPDNTEVLEITAGKDDVSLVTCTPYGLNTHRLVVTGERVPYEESEYNSIGSELPSLRELLFISIPFVLLAVAGGLKFKDWRKKKHAQENITKVKK